MIVAPGNLVEQWQDELREKFQLPFEIMTNDKFESAYSVNYKLYELLKRGAPPK